MDCDILWIIWWHPTLLVHVLTPVYRFIFQNGVHIHRGSWLCATHTDSGRRRRRRCGSARRKCRCCWKQTGDIFQEPGNCRSHHRPPLDTGRFWKYRGVRAVVKWTLKWFFQLHHSVEGVIFRTIDWLIDQIVRLMDQTLWLIDWFDWLIDPIVQLIDWFDWLIDPIVQLIDWLIDWMMFRYTIEIRHAGYHWTILRSYEQVYALHFCQFFFDRSLRLKDQIDG